MQKLTLGLVVSILSVLGRTNCEKNKNVTNEIVPDVPPAGATLLVDLETEKAAKNGTNLDDVEIRGKCQHKNYRSYVKCLLEESRRKKRQCGPSGTSCETVIRPQACSGSGCLPGNQRCIDAGCLRGTTSQLPCSGTGCVFIGHNCGGVGCLQIGQTCYGVGCLPAPYPQTPCTRPSGCNVPPAPAPAPAPENPNPPVIVDTTEIRQEIGDIKEQLRIVEEQNEKLIEITEKATMLIMQFNNRPAPEPKIIREPFLVEHNLTTSIDISNYLKNTNVINLPSKPAEQPEGKPHCCIVVRPRTCRRSSQPPYFVCGHRRHRTCGYHCSGRRVVHGRVRPGCTGDSTEHCVSYESNPYHQTHPGYSTSGYYPQAPIYYPPMGAQYYPIYAPPPMPIYGPAPTYQTADGSDYPDEDCEDCKSEMVIEDCEDSDLGCKPVAVKGGVGHTGSMEARSIPLAELDHIKKEALAIKRSEDQPTASLGMLEEPVEFKRLEEKRDDEKKIIDTKIADSEGPKGSSSSGK